MFSYHTGTYRNKNLLTAAQARSFARCIAANPYFAGVQCYESPQAKDPIKRWVVSYRPSQAARARGLMDAVQAQSARRAAAEGDAYTWVADPDHAEWHLISASGEVYQVDTGARQCSCPQWHYRSRYLGQDCKHLIALREHRGTFLTVEDFHAEEGQQLWHVLHNRPALVNRETGEIIEAAA